MTDRESASEHDQRARYSDRIEQKWQARWSDGSAFVRRPGEGPKWYVVELPPFATGNLHLGHARNYTLADAGARFRRMAGHDVLYTTGYDSFGLPSEIAARDAGVHPMELVDGCVAEMALALRRLGLSHDPERITAYHVPAYYKWVQWVFLRLLEAGHCERREGPVLWCAGCDASLAESLAEEGRCWRCRTEVELRSVPQWYVKEEHFADSMLDGLERLRGWPDAVRRVHRDWIGRRFGRKVTLEAEDGSLIEIFVEDGIPLAAAAAIAVPEGHRLTADGSAPLLLRHPSLAAPLPAISVPERLLPAPDIAIPLVHGRNAAHDRLLSQRGLRPPMSVAEEPEGVCAKIYRLRDWSIARQRYWGPPVPVVHCQACGIVPVPDEALPVLLPRLPLDGPGNPLAADPDFGDTSCPRCGGGARRDTDTFEAYSSPWWYHWMCMENDDPSPFEPERAASLLPVDVMMGGNDQIRSCFFHVRMIAKALAAVGVVHVEEPVERLIAIGMIQKDGQKMSKSAGNAVALDELLHKFGADAVRFAVLAAAAPERDVNWSDGALLHAAEFLARLRRFGTSIEGAQSPGDGVSTQPLRDKLIGWVGTGAHKVTANLLRHQYHLVPRNLEMLFDRLNHFAQKTGSARSRVDVDALRSAWGVFVRLLCPVAPHLAEELWEGLGREAFVSRAPWPVAFGGEGPAARPKNRSMEVAA